MFEYHVDTSHYTLDGALESLLSFRHMSKKTDAVFVLNAREHPPTDHRTKHRSLRNSAQLLRRKLRAADRHTVRKVKAHIEIDAHSDHFDGTESSKWVQRPIVQAERS